MSRRCVAVLGVALAAVLSGCLAPQEAPQEASPVPRTTPPAPTSPATAGATTPAAAGGDAYLHLARELADRGVAVWFEADLVKSWLAGPRELRADVERLGRLAASVDTAGFKIADELGYHDGLDSAAEATRFLRDTRAALRRVAPGRPLLVDMVVPGLGCLPWRGAEQRSCADSVDHRYPGSTVAAVTSYLRAGLVDRLDLSTGLLDDATYRSWGLTLPEAQADAWRHVAQLGWPELTRLQARKALAAPGGYQGSAAGAARDVAVYVDAPVSAGAGAVDVWTWRQPYDGATVSLLADNLAGNALWTALVRRRAAGVHLFTHMTPSAMPADPSRFDAECDRVAEVFDAVFVAAGTG